jgi:hypothetical protein
MIEQKDLQIAKITGDQIGHDLAVTVGKYLVPTREATQDEVNIAGLVALGDQICIWRDRSRLLNDLIEKRDGGMIQLDQICQFTAQ